MSAAVEKPWKKTRGVLARKSQDLPPDAPELRELRAELKTQRAEEYIEKVLSQAPPLTDEQRTRLAELLRPARRLPQQAHADLGLVDDDGLVGA